MYDNKNKYAELNDLINQLTWSQSCGEQYCWGNIVIDTGNSQQRQAINESLDYLSKNMPEIASFIGKNVKNIVLLNSESGEYHGFSRGDEFQTIFLYNVESLSSDPHILSAGIIHESIHQEIFRIENSVSYFLSEALLGNEYKVNSPWTGNEIHINSFVHAAHVWFGLYHYWDKYLFVKPDPYDNSLAQQQRSKLLQGFDNDQYGEINLFLKNNNQHRAMYSILKLKKIMGDKNEKNRND
ncbi:hypothetical protein D515_01974 [Grimontia indica]|uniref:Uncharacterized protein n=1 Tax=Grimontia indica TaxID=1056512 RepID=R1IVH7_9GAMM|nr:hypothetical protein [Grimontia indica]EOD79310.1 hypothetical protein D515_01974 [Grimontia indica]